MARTRIPKSNPQHKENGCIKAEKLKQQFSKSGDFVSNVHAAEKDELEIFYFDTLADTKYLDQYILPKLAAEKDGTAKDKLRTLFQADLVTEKSIDDLSLLLFDGNFLFLADQHLLSIKAANLPKRQPEESALETSIRGPKDGFVEDLQTNISLIRRRLNTSTLCVEKYTIGKRSKTKVALMYIEDIIDQRVLEEIHKRMGKVELDILTSIHELDSLIRDRPFSIFPSLDYTGRPDFIVQALNQGRFAILVEGNPTVTFAPVSLLLQTKSPEDHYINYAFVSLERIIRMIGITVSGFLPGVWIAFSAFNIEQIPYLMVATISVSRFGLPLSAPIEMFIILLLFELFNEAGIRLPRAIGQTVAVLGGLIVGDAAIRAGLTSPTMLVVSAITYISSFTLVNQSLSSAITIVRFIVIIVSTFLGLFGVIVCYILTVLYLSTLSSFGVPYLSSIAPISWRESVKAFLMLPVQFYKSRASATSPEDPTRGDK
ncbi:spore germination protein [Cytobacillus pseudoceanisediminis]|uniref:Spore germination protein n=1 Tax=Cytobacillus pseudoceanisediminis TaxID=3051614 RepID=A0ABZ2ZCF7_9BACI|nr:spore germination protein [Cytobacillus oceanisediminis]MBU8732158.1 spore germination protein [Cytobacillus oceanisediminis]